MTSLVTGIIFCYRMNYTHLYFSSVGLTGRTALSASLQDAFSEPHPGLWALPLAPSLSLSASPTRPHSRAVICEASVPGTRAHTFVKQLTEHVQNRPGLMKIHPQDEKPTVRACTASHSCGDWILWASSRTAICGLGDKQTTFSRH